MAILKETEFKKKLLSYLMQEAYNISPWAVIPFNPSLITYGFNGHCRIVVNNLDFILVFVCVCHLINFSSITGAGAIYSNLVARFYFQSILYSFIFQGHCTQFHGLMWAHTNFRGTDWFICTNPMTDEPSYVFTYYVSWDLSSIAILSSSTVGKL